MTEPAHGCCIGAFAVLPPEIRCKIWRSMWRSHSGLSILRTCQAIYHEALYEIYDLSDLTLRMDPEESTWMVKDIRKLSTTYATYLTFCETASFLKFVYALQKSSRITKIKIEICPPTESDPVQAMKLRAPAYRESLYSFLLSISSEHRSKVEFILLHGHDKANWSGFHTFEPKDKRHQKLTVPDAQAVLLQFCSIRNLPDVEVILPQSLTYDRQMLDFASQMERDLTSNESTWLAERSRVVAKARESKLAIEPSLMHQDMELSLRFQMLLDILPGNEASSLRAQKFQDMYSEFFNHMDWRTRVIYHSRDLEVAIGIGGRVDWDEVHCAMYTRERAARTWFGANSVTEYEYTPPLDMNSPVWEDLLECATDVKVEQHLLNDEPTDFETIEEELFHDPAYFRVKGYPELIWNTDELLMRPCPDVA